MTEAAAVRWESGDLHEPYVGRWSRPVARALLSWLNAPTDLDWLDVYASGKPFNYPHPAAQPVRGHAAPNTSGVRPVGLERCSGGADGDGFERMGR